MSQFSGKCDLFDTLMMQKHRTKTGSDDKKDLEEARVLYSDELECFTIFKNKTGGILHQHQFVKIDEYNQDEVAKRSNGNFQVLSQKITYTTKTGLLKEKTIYTYKYYNKEYNSLKELNKHGVYIVRDIHFDTLLDLIPYYPYIVTCMYSDSNSLVVFISNESYVISSRNSMWQAGNFSNFWEVYAKNLQNHYLEVCQRYFLPEYENRIQTVDIKDITPYDTENYIMTVEEPIDYMHESYFVFDGDSQSYWSSPKYLDEHHFLISAQNIEFYLKEAIKNNTVHIKYVKAMSFPLYLD
jgi:hypothetical protein